MRDERESSLSIHTALDLHSEEARFYTDVCRPLLLLLLLPLSYSCIIESTCASRRHWIGSGWFGGWASVLLFRRIDLHWVDVAQSTHTALLCAPLLIFLILFAKCKNDTEDGLSSRRNNRSIDLHTHTHTHKASDIDRTKGKLLPTSETCQKRQVCDF